MVAEKKFISILVIIAYIHLKKYGKGVFIIFNIILVLEIK